MMGLLTKFVATGSQPVAAADGRACSVEPPPPAVSAPRSPAVRRDPSPEAAADQQWEEWLQDGIVDSLLPPPAPPTPKAKPGPSGVRSKVKGKAATGRKSEADVGSSDSDIAVLSDSDKVKFTPSLYSCENVMSQVGALGSLVFL